MRKSVRPSPIRLSCFHNAIADSRKRFFLALGRILGRWALLHLEYFNGSMESFSGTALQKSLWNNKGKRERERKKGVGMGNGKKQRDRESGKEKAFKGRRERERGKGRRERGRGKEKRPHSVEIERRRLFYAT